MAPTELRHRTSRPLKEACTVYQQTGQTDPKKPARFKKLDQKIKKKITPLTVKMEKAIYYEAAVSRLDTSQSSRTRSQDHPRAPHEQPRTVLRTLFLIVETYLMIHDTTANG